MNTQSLVKKESSSIGGYLNTSKEKIVEVLGKEGFQSFVTSLVASVSTNPTLSGCTNQSLLTSALIGASLNLPCSQALGYWYLVPFENHKTKTKTARYLELAERFIR